MRGAAGGSECEEQGNLLSRLENGLLEPVLCRVCLLFQPMRVKHCLECRRCVHAFDHHCPYIGQCVGEGNHRYFVVFLAAHSALAM